MDLLKIFLKRILHLNPRTEVNSEQQSSFPHLAHSAGACSWELLTSILCLKKWTEKLDPWGLDLGASSIEILDFQRHMLRFHAECRHIHAKSWQKSFKQVRRSHPSSASTPKVGFHAEWIPRRLLARMILRPAVRPANGRPLGRPLGRP